MEPCTTQILVAAWGQPWLGSLHIWSQVPPRWLPGDSPDRRAYFFGARYHPGGCKGAALAGEPTHLEPGTTQVAAWGQPWLESLHMWSQIPLRHLSDNGLSLRACIYHTTSSRSNTFNLSNMTSVHVTRHTGLALMCHVQNTHISNRMEA